MNQCILIGARHEVEADRVLATVMFTDIVDSTRRAAELGDRKWRAIDALGHQSGGFVDLIEHPDAYAQAG